MTRHEYQCFVHQVFFEKPPAWYSFRSAVFCKIVSASTTPTKLSFQSKTVVLFSRWWLDTELLCSVQNIINLINMLSLWRSERTNNIELLNCVSI